MAKHPCGCLGVTRQLMSQLSPNMKTHTHNIEVIYSMTRNDGKPCTQADLRTIIDADALDVDTTDSTHRRFSDCLDSILDDAPVLSCGAVTCHALVTITTDDSDEDATADRVGQAVRLPDIDGYDIEFVNATPVSL